MTQETAIRIAEALEALYWPVFMAQMALWVLVGLTIGRTLWGK